MGTIVRQSHLILLSRLVILELIFISLYLALRIPKFVFNGYIPSDLFYDLSYIGLVTAIFLTIMQVILAVWVTLIWSSEYYIIKENEIIHRKGVLSLQEDTFSLNNVESFTIKENIIGKLFNVGNLSFYSPVLRQEYILLNVHNPVQIKEYIEKSVKNKREDKKIIPVRR